MAKHLKSATNPIGARIIVALGILFLVFDGVSHVLNLSQVKTASATISFPDNLIPLIGVIELICLVIYVYPRTAILGAILLSGYLGGAIAVNLRAETPIFNVLFPFIIAGFVWAPLYLRDPKLRFLIPLSIQN